jgi:hypothetical protein
MNGRPLRSAAGVCLAALVGVAVSGGPATMNALAENGPGPPPKFPPGNLLALNGLPASVSCREVANGRGGVEIWFDGARIPLPGSGNGTSERISGVLHADGSLSAVLTDVDAGAGLSIRNAPEGWARPLADACRAAANAMPGMAG